MHKAAQSVFQIYECTIRLQAFYRAFHNGSRYEHRHLVVMLLSGLLPQDFSCRQHQFLLLSVYRDDPDLQRFSLIFFKILHIRQRQMRSRNKSADTFQIGNHSRIHNLTYLDSDLFLLLQITGQYIPCKYRVRFFS